MGGNRTSSSSSSPVGILDVVVFSGLELLGGMAILGNAALILVLLRNKYLNRASFILMLSLAIADVLHGFVTTLFFYPPVILKYLPVSEMGVRLFNLVDWTAWAVTLTHMSAICLDRLVAIMLYGRYNQLVTVPRIRNFCITCWVFFFSTNCAFFFFDFCCLTRPLAEYNFLTFGYPTHSVPRLNVYTLFYTPVEVLTICILSISNPITLVQLYRRHKRKVALRMQGSSKTSVGSGLLGGSQRSQWQRASTMLLEMSMKMGSKQITHDVRDLATRRANRQQQRILVQISVVALIFYAYMTAYYISYYVSILQSTATLIFNSFFYSTTHMINPVIYFSLNKEMRDQLRDAIKGFYHTLTCRPKPPLPSRSNTHREHTCFSMDRMQPSCTTYSETVPFFSSSSCTNYKMTGSTQALLKDKDDRMLGVNLENALPDKISEGDEEEEETREECLTLIESLTATKDLWTDEMEKLNKLEDRERSEFMSDLIEALKCGSGNVMPNNNNEKSEDLLPSKQKLTASLSLDLQRGINGKFIRVSNTLQVISKSPRTDSDSALLFPSSSTFDREVDEPLLNGRSHSVEEKTDTGREGKPLPNRSSSSTPPSSFTDSWHDPRAIDEFSLLPNEFVDSSDDEISYL